MKAMTLSNVAKLIGGRVIGDGDVVIQEVNQYDLTFDWSTVEGHN